MALGWLASKVSIRRRHSKDATGTFRRLLQCTKRLLIAVFSSKPTEESFAIKVKTLAIARTRAPTTAPGVSEKGSWKVSSNRAKISRVDAPKGAGHATVESLNRATKWERSHVMRWAPLAGGTAEEEDGAVFSVVDEEALEAGARMSARRAVSR